MLALDAVGTHYTNKNLPHHPLKIPDDAPKQKVGRPHEKDDAADYFIVHVRKDEYPADKEKGWQAVPAGRYLVDASGQPKYLTDMPITRKSDQKMDDGEPAPKGFSAPQPELFASIIEGILGGTLEWALFVVGVLIAIALELAGVRALPVAVGMYLPISSSTPIFFGGMIRWVSDKIRGVSASEAETETSPGVLLSSGYIAGGTLCGLIVAFFAFLPDAFNKLIDIGRHIWGDQLDEAPASKLLSLATFLVLGVILFFIGLKKTPQLPAEEAQMPPPGGPDTRIKASTD